MISKAGGCSISAVRVCLAVVEVVDMVDGDFIETFHVVNEDYMGD